jgi:hypothetical protein
MGSRLVVFCVSKEKSVLTVDAALQTVVLVGIAGRALLDFVEDQHNLVEVEDRHVNKLAQCQCRVLRLLQNRIC